MLCSVTWMMCLLNYLFFTSQGCNKNHWVHGCTLSGTFHFLCRLCVVLHWRVVLKLSLCLRSDCVRASGRTSGGPYHPGWDHGEPRHTEGTLEDVQKVEWDHLDVEWMWMNWRQNEGIYEMCLFQIGVLSEEIFWSQCLCCFLKVTEICPS